MQSKLRHAMLAALAATLAAPAARAEGNWEHTVVLYAMGAAIDGEATIGDLTVPIDFSMSDVFSALEMGAMGAYRVEDGTWSFTADATYMSLGGTAEGRRDLLKGEVDVDQITLMGTVGRRLTPHLEALFSLAWFDLSAELDARLRNPVTGGVIDRSASTDASWVDPLVGLQYNVPFADRWRFNLRGDIGGFGVGSDLSYQLLANFRWQMNERFGLAFGYRLIAFDYEDGRRGTRGYQRFDLTEQGPLVGLTISF
jgi:hypothetical protein